MHDKRAKETRNIAKFCLIAKTVKLPPEAHLRLLEESGYTVDLLKSLLHRITLNTKFPTM